MHALKYESDQSNWSPARKITGVLTSRIGDTEMARINPDNTASAARRTKFKGIDPGVEYTFRVSTLINGKTISRKLITLKPSNTDAENASENV